jgi:hypothetical protein
MALVLVQPLRSHSWQCRVVLSKEDIATGSMSQLTLLMIRELMLRF